MKVLDARNAESSSTSTSVPGKVTLDAAFFASLVRSYFETFQPVVFQKTVVVHQLNNILVPLVNVNSNRLICFSTRSTKRLLRFSRSHSGSWIALNETNFVEKTFGSSSWNKKVEYAHENQSISTL